ncbi:hypothetical protein Taro_041455 [Colocasia esculenta]|uniref:WRKY domain-containing protein n=1 Tax=Colocasia esculenta TaxID=4460 RepID=A0A843X0K3_COLES|nr:hypothetical protein [Colocasia esculenta]
MEVMMAWAPVVKEEKEAESLDGEGHSGRIEKNPLEDDRLESARAEMGEVKRENERLKATLSRIMKDYRSLQTQLSSIVPQEQDKKPLEKTDSNSEREESELVSLSLGVVRNGEVERTAASTKTTEKGEVMINHEGLSLGMDCRPTEDDPSSWSREKSPEERKEEEADAGELPWPPSKVLKTWRPGDREVPQQSIHGKTTRVSVRARCDTPTVCTHHLRPMNDGCQWRKYGQKVAKGNPCPRAYYRCTAAPGCPVRKQVQRCAGDMSILITTYEGTHSHPLPLSATAMASTTSAAARMLMEGPLVSRQQNPASAMAGLHVPIISFPGDPRQRRFPLPNPSISSSLSHTTITLDFASPPSSAYWPYSAQTCRLPSNLPSPSSFTFSPSEANPSSNPFSSSGHLSFGVQEYDDQSQVARLFGPGRRSQDPFRSQPDSQNNTSSHPLADTVAAATEAIAADPSFQSALAAAVTSVLGGQEALLQKLRWGEQFSPVSPFEPSLGENGYAGSSYLTRSNSSTMNPQQGDVLRPLQTSTSAFWGPKNGYASPEDNSSWEHS